MSANSDPATWTHDYVRLCLCGGWVEICVDFPGNARDIGNLVAVATRRGQEYKRLPIAEACAIPSGCSCPPAEAS